jgi:hypothetical protein
MELLNLQHVSPESIRDGMVTHEDPLSDEVPFAEGYARAKQKAQELDGYASLFGEMPSSVTPAKGREILNQEGFEYRDSFDQVEQYHDAWGIVATLRDYGREAIIVFHLQTIFAACPLLLLGSRSPFCLLNGDIVFKYSITAQPGVLTMIRMVRPYALRPWRVPYSEESLAGVGYGLSPLHQLKEFPPLIDKHECFTLQDLMAGSGEALTDEGTTSSGGSKRYWFKPFQAAICFRTEGDLEAKKWLDLYLQLADFARREGCRLNERSAVELQLTGKLCCVDQQRRSRKVQLRNGKLVVLDYCDAAQPELP